MIHIAVRRPVAVASAGVARVALVTAGRLLWSLQVGKHSCQACLVDTCPLPTQRVLPSARVEHCRQSELYLVRSNGSMGPMVSDAKQSTGLQLGGFIFT